MTRDIPSEFEEEYDGKLDAWLEGDKARVAGALLKDPISRLEPRQPVTVAPTVPVRACIDLMVQHAIGCVLVVEGDALAGIFTERDVLKRVAAQGIDPATTPVSAVMTRAPETLSASDRIVVALNRMMVGGYRHIPVTDGHGKPVGILSVRNFVKFIVSLYPEEVLNQPPSQGLKHPSQVDGG